ncbi:LysE family translocator [Shewanella sp. OMA3-2]|uniref:LysE family translocator n=1 Tax=Shewanella sp. OMA3-2 TaxID=2908650 RepID=UPI001F3F2491|nr:LysE family transporter [Shewanella sp. OMA3-2]UJF21073.1 LysE family transporter [Shewanella sp. OMA3-2]
MDFTLLASLAVIHTIALISPGPDFAIIVKMASQQSRNTAVACALGIAIAILIHTLLSLLGISLMIRQSPLAYTIVQCVGVSYLAWMGFQALKSALSRFKSIAASTEKTMQTLTTDKPNTASFGSLKGFKIGLLTNLFNPKALIFFITLFTVLITPDVNLITKIAATTLLFFLSLIWFSLLALVLSKPLIQSKLLNVSHIIDLLVGIIFIGVSVTIAVNLINDF